MKHKRVSRGPRRASVTVKVRFVAGSRHPKGAKADVVWSEVQAIQAQRSGAVTAADVVAAASNPASALHAFFDWNDTSAAHEYRLSQARRLLCSIEIMPGEDRPPVRAMLVVTEDEDDAYRSTVDVMKNDAWREQVLRRAYGEVLSWRNRYSDFLEFAKVFADVDEMPAPPVM